MRRLANFSNSLSVNLRFLLWKQETDRSLWYELIQSCTGCDHNRAGEILLTGVVNKGELGQLANYFGITEEDLKFSDLPQSNGCNILAENLKRLISGLEHGIKKDLAELFEIHPTTISRWLNGSIKPDRVKLKKLCDYFAISNVDLLVNEPLFLSISPVSEYERRVWLRNRVEKLDSITLNKLFPAFEKLLE